MDFREYKAKMAVVAELIANYKKADAIGIDNNKIDARVAEIDENFVEKDVDEFQVAHARDLSRELATDFNC